MRDKILSTRVTSDENKKVNEKKRKLKMRSTSEFLRYFILRFIDSL